MVSARKGRIPDLELDAVKYLYDDYLVDNSKLKSMGYRMIYPDFRESMKQMGQWYQAEAEKIKQVINKREVQGWDRLWLLPVARMEWGVTLPKCWPAAGHSVAGFDVDSEGITSLEKELKEIGGDHLLETIDITDRPAIRKFP